MTTQPIMPMEEVTKYLAEHLDSIRFSKPLAERVDQLRYLEADELRTLSILHHLEAGKRKRKGGCKCHTFKHACEFWRDSDGVNKLGYGNPPVNFCPWCGGKLTSPTNEQG